MPTALRRNETKRTVLNRQVLSAVNRGFVRGLAVLGRTVIERADPPDAPPLGEGLVETGNWVVYAGTKKVAGTAPKPRGVKLSPTGITLVGGYDFPARFQEEGTANQSARPFLTPALMETVDDLVPLVGPEVRSELARVR